MAVTKTRKAEIIREHGGKETNSGDTSVQVAVLTERINDITNHLQNYPKDNHSRHGLLKLVGRRRTLLEYLAKTDVEKYRALIKKLNIRK